MGPRGRERGGEKEGGVVISREKGWNRNGMGWESRRLNGNGVHDNGRGEKGWVNVKGMN